ATPSSLLHPMSYHPAQSLVLPSVSPISLFSFFFFFTATATTEIYTLSLHDALPISFSACAMRAFPSTTQPAYPRMWTRAGSCFRSEEHTSELQSRFDLVCRLLLEKKKNTTM